VHLFGLRSLFCGVAYHAATDVPLIARIPAFMRKVKGHLPWRTPLMIAHVGRLTRGLYLSRLPAVMHAIAQHACHKLPQEASVSRLAS